MYLIKKKKKKNNEDSGISKSNKNFFLIFKKKKKKKNIMYLTIKSNYLYSIRLANFLFLSKISTSVPPPIHFLLINTLGTLLAPVIVCK